MGNKITITQGPVIMTANFLEERVIRDKAHMEDLDISEFQKLVKLDGLEYDVILKLNLEHQSLVNIDDLWRFEMLTKLEMPNNLLERIEGLDCLVNLQILDLSFNFIKKIIGLENLINLIHLNLTSNEITILESMEALQKLETFLIRHNKMMSFDNIHYLTDFKNLSSLAIDKNPFMKDADVKLHIIAVLPHLKFLDYNVVTADQLKKALKKYPSEDITCKKDEVVYKSTEKTFKCTFHHSDKEAYVDGLSNGQGFQSFLTSERNFELLLSFPPALPITNEYCSKVTELFDEWHKQGHKYYEQIQQEKSEFLAVISEARKFALETSREEELKFTDFKEKMPKELCLIYQNSASDEERDIKVMQYKKSCESFLLVTVRQLMQSMCLYLDLVSNICKIYEKEVTLINAKYIQDVENFVQNIMDINEIYAYQLQEFYFSIYESGFDSTEEFLTDDGNIFELDPVFLQLMQKKQLIKETLELSVRIHSTSLHERLKSLKSSLQNDLIKTLDKVTNETFFKQSEETRNIVICFNKQRCFIDKFFSKNHVFKHYLGYR